MKKSFISILALSLVLASCSNSESKKESGNDSTATVQTETPASPDYKVKKYPVKSAIVTFDNDFMGTKEKLVLYIDDYGMKEAEEIYEGDSILEINACDGKNRYKIKVKSKTAVSIGECSRGIAFKFDWNEISQKDKDENKAKKLPNMTVAGKDCESFSYVSGSSPTVFAGWNNICLYSSTKSTHGDIVMKAVKIEENVTVPAEKFKVPEGYALK